MSMSKQILVAVDGSNTADAALQRALELGREGQARLHPFRPCLRQHSRSTLLRSIQRRRWEWQPNSR
jgi:nucleotide-binding universal stress UspA family protein